MHKPTDFQIPSDDEHRAKVTLVILELNNLMHRFWGVTKDPVAACMVSAAVAHGCAVGTPFGISQLSYLTNLSRRKVYDTMGELIAMGLFMKADIEGYSYPAYVRNLNAPQQEKAVPDIYAEITQVCQRLFEGVQHEHPSNHN